MNLPNVLRNNLWALLNAGRGMYSLPRLFRLSSFQGSSVVELANEIQVIKCEAAAWDTFTPLGFFVITFEGRSSIPISPTASAWEMQRALEGVLTIDSVHVEVQDIPVASEYGPPYFLRPGNHGRRWVVTFTGQPFNLPSMLVSTRAGGRGADLFATAGTLGGSAPMVSVETVANGGLPTSMTATIHARVEPKHKYFVRVSAFNGIGWSSYAMAAVAVRSISQVGGKSDLMSVKRHPSFLLIHLAIFFHCSRPRLQKRRL